MVVFDEAKFRFAIQKISKADHLKARLDIGFRKLGVSKNGEISTNIILAPPIRITCIISECLLSAAKRIEVDSRFYEMLM
jgi:hypothetical protein